MHVNGKIFISPTCALLNLIPLIDVTFQHPRLMTPTSIVPVPGVRLHPSDNRRDSPQFRDSALQSESGLAAIDSQRYGVHSIEFLAARDTLYHVGHSLSGYVAFIARTSPTKRDL
jgi:hypothetical protein